eukprot:2023929-Prorocentrum_lima.AAC.1
MGQVNMYGLGSRVPKAIDSSHVEKHPVGQQITLGVGIMELIETSGNVAKNVARAWSTRRFSPDRLNGY